MIWEDSGGQLQRRDKPTICLEGTITTSIIFNSLLAVSARRVRCIIISQTFTPEMHTVTLPRGWSYRLDAAPYTGIEAGGPSDVKMCIIKPHTCIRLHSISIPSVYH